MMSLTDCSDNLVALLQRDLAGRASATSVLQDYCSRRNPQSPRIHAVLLPTAGAIAPADLRVLLQTTESEPIVVRHVSLRCGETELSNAWNWYLPARLTKDMNDRLATTDVPFGRSVAALRFTRIPLSSITQGLPSGTILRNRAVLRRGADALSFSYVEENYRDTIFAP